MCKWTKFRSQTEYQSCFLRPLSNLRKIGPVIMCKWTKFRSQTEYQSCFLRPLSSAHHNIAPQQSLKSRLQKSKMMEYQALRALRTQKHYISGKVCSRHIPIDHFFYNLHVYRGNPTLSVHPKNMAKAIFFRMPTGPRQPAAPCLLALNVDLAAGAGWILGPNE